MASFGRDRLYGMTLGALQSWCRIPGMNREAVIAALRAHEPELEGGRRCTAVAVRLHDAEARARTVRVRAKCLKNTTASGATSQTSASSS